MEGGMDFWREHVAAVERDGLVCSEYARVHGLSVTSLYYWRTKFRALEVSAAPRGKFITLDVVSPQVTSPAGACVLTVGAVRMEMGTPPDPDWLAALAMAAERGR